MALLEKKEKLIARLKSMPKDFTFEEMETLLIALGFDIPASIANATKVVFADCEAVKNRKAIFIEADNT